MNNNELNAELERNKSDKKISMAELEASQKKWAEYALNNINEICLHTKPVIVKKKYRYRWKEFLTKIKTIMGFTKANKKEDGIETYLQYRNNIEELI